MIDKTGLQLQKSFNLSILTFQITMIIKPIATFDVREVKNSWEYSDSILRIYSTESDTMILRNRDFSPYQKINLEKNKILNRILAEISVRTLASCPWC